jgi:hypothetical protein
VYHEIFRLSIAVAIHRTDAAMGELFKNLKFGSGLFARIVNDPRI